MTRLQYVDRPKLRLFLLHSAGGSHMMFRGWDRHFPADWELCPIEAPGRGRLAGQPLPKDAAAFAAVALPAMIPLLGSPFAIFGHSMGGLLAFDLTLRLAMAGLPQPVWVGVSARRAPGQRPGGTATLSWDFPVPKLRDALGIMGGTSPSILDDPRQWAIMEPILRADLRLSETWAQPGCQDVIASPLSVFAGADDPFVPPHDLQPWQQHSSRFLGLHRFPGAHFYLQHCLPELAGQIVADVTEACAPHPA